MVVAAPAVAAVAAQTHQIPALAAVRQRDLHQVVFRRDRVGSVPILSRTRIIRRLAARRQAQDLSCRHSLLDHSMACISIQIGNLWMHFSCLIFHFLAVALASRRNFSLVLVLGQLRQGSSSDLAGKDKQKIWKRNNSDSSLLVCCS
jgi:hypothetical protein